MGSLRKMSFKLLALTFVFSISHNLSYSYETKSEEMKEVMKYNRETLSLVSNWLDKSSLQTSLGRYGLPAIAVQHMDSYIGNEVTYSDLVAYLSSFLTDQIQYLEIGVSVGKNFFQICNYLQQSIAIGLDLDKPNKSLESFFSNCREKSSWDSFTQISNPYNHEIWFKKYGFTSEWLMKGCSGAYKVQPENRYLQYNYDNRSNDIYYLVGDVLDESLWEKLSKDSFKLNLIFSDAFHFNDAVLYEYEMMQKYNLLNKDEFVLVFDDLNAVGGGFNRIWTDIKKESSGDIFKFIVFVKGWIGNNEDSHPVGVIMKSKNISSLSSLTSLIGFLDILEVSN